MTSKLFKAIGFLLAITVVAMFAQINQGSGGGGGSGTVTSVTMAGTSNQIAVAGTCTVTTSGTCTFSIPSSPTLPGTTTGTFSGALTGNSSTSTALATNGANCGAGNYPLGVNASGAVEDCTSAGAGTYGTYSSKPATCTVGSTYYTSNSPYHFFCATTNVWTGFLYGQESTPVDVTGQTTTVSGAIDNSTTTLVVAANFGSMPSTPFFIMIGTEQMKVTNVASTTWTFTRGDGGTTAASHADTATVTEMLYSWSDKDSSTAYTNVGGVLTIERSASAGTGQEWAMKMKVKLAYSAPWTVIARLGVNVPQANNNISYGLAMWAVGDITKDVRIAAGFYNSAWNGPYDIFYFSGSGFASAISGGTPGPTYHQLNSNYQYTSQQPIWLKWVDNTTNWLTYFSLDGTTWYLTTTVARNTSVTPTHVGPYVSPRGARIGVSMLSLRQYNSVQ